MTSSDENYLTILIADYTAARDDERETRSQLVALFSAVVATIALFGAFVVGVSQPEEGTDSAAPQFVVSDEIAAATPLIPLSLFCIIQMLASEATLRSFYSRILERQISLFIPDSRRSEMYGYSGLPPAIYRELVDGQSSLSRGSHPIRFITLTLILSAIFVFAGLVLYMAKDFDFYLQFIMLMVYGSGIVILSREALSVSLRGRSYFLKAAELAVEKRQESLLPSPPPAGRGRHLLSYLALPRPMDLTKVPFFILGVLFLVAFDPSIAHTSYFWERAIILVLVVEFLAYQGRYQWNDIRGIGEDLEAPAASSRKRFPLEASTARTTVGFISTSIVLRFGTAVALSGLAFLSFFHHVLPVFLSIWTLAMIYEYLRGRERNAHASANGQSFSPSNRLNWGVLFVVGLGYPLRFVLGAWLPATALNSPDIPWTWAWPWKWDWASAFPPPVGGLLQVPVPPWALFWSAIYLFILGILFVSMTWCLEGGTYITNKQRNTENYFYDSKILAKPHLVPLLQSTDASYRPDHEMVFIPDSEHEIVDGQTVKWIDKGSKRHAIWALAAPSCVVVGSIVNLMLWGGFDASRPLILWHIAFIILTIVGIASLRTPWWDQISPYWGRILCVIGAAYFVAMIVPVTAEVGSQSLMTTLVRLTIGAALFITPGVLYVFFESNSYKTAMRPPITIDTLNKAKIKLLDVILGAETRRRLL